MKLPQQQQTVLSNHSPAKILIVGPSWVGDMVMAQSLFMVLKQQYPEATIDVLAPAWSRPIIERMPEVNKAIDMPLGHGHFGLKDRWILGRALQKEGYTQSIILPNSWKSALIPWFAKIPVRTGWKGEARYGLLNDLRKLDKVQLPMMVQRFVALAYPALPYLKSGAKKTSNTSLENCPPPSLLIDKNRLPTLLQHFGLNTRKPTLILCPGAEFGPAKQWPAEHYSATAAHMIKTGYQVWVMGSSGDIAIAEAIYSQIKDKIDTASMTILCGKTSLEEAIDLLSIADKVLSNDSGLMHIASALNKPLVALYGATSPEFTPPLSSNARIVSIEVDCGPCFKRECPEGHHKCMNSLNPEAVLKVLNEP
jgi:heptosyltransferase-2